MRALVLGGNGFIGSHLTDRLLMEGHDVRVFDKYEERCRPPLRGVDYHLGDFGNRGLLAEALRDREVVYHLVWNTVPKTSNDDAFFDVSSNLADTLFLLEECVRREIGRIVFISSGGTVYGNPRSLPVSEESPTEPLCSYGITKLAVEKYLALYRHLHGLEYVILRPSNPYGIRQNPLGSQGAVSVFLWRLARGESLDIWGDGSVVRDYVFIGDLVDGIYRASVSRTPSRIFNLGSGRGISLNQLLSVIHTVTGREAAVRYSGGRRFDVPEIYLDIERARRELGWEPVTTLEEGIGRTWRQVLEACRS
ncbi:MAG: NAD-dependent epimerase/dehydratase family protein [Syntrophaceae bacterium]|nr:NAD-dependent epimerase/dehydratase family protein [Syntrophaceae bacterium]